MKPMIQPRKHIHPLHFAWYRMNRWSGWSICLQIWWFPDDSEGVEFAFSRSWHAVEVLFEKLCLLSRSVLLTGCLLVLPRKKRNVQLFFNLSSSLLRPSLHFASMLLWNSLQRLGCIKERVRFTLIICLSTSLWFVLAIKNIIVVSFVRYFWINWIRFEIVGRLFKEVHDGRFARRWSGLGVLEIFEDETLDVIWLLRLMRRARWQIGKRIRANFRLLTRPFDVVVNMIRHVFRGNVLFWFLF